MKSAFTFKGNPRPDENRDETYPNYPLLVSLMTKPRTCPPSNPYNRGVYFDPYKINESEKLVPVYRSVDYKIHPDFIKDWLVDEPVNYMIGDVAKEEVRFLGKGVDQIIPFQNVSQLPQNFHYFELNLPYDFDDADWKEAPGSTKDKPLWTGQGAGTLHITSTPKYNFYVGVLEALDKNTDQSIQKVIRPNDFYAYKSIKILGDKTKDLTYKDFAYKTWAHMQTYVGEINTDDKTVIFDWYKYENDIKSFYQKYFLQGSYADTDYEEQYQKHLSDRTGIDQNYFRTNNTSFISQDKILLDATSNQESILPFAVVLESNYNMVTENAANNEFKKLLQDMNLYETFIYNMVDRHGKPYFSISDDGDADFTSPQTLMNSPDQFVLRRAPCVAQTLLYALNTTGFPSPASSPLKQNIQLKDLTKWVDKNFDPKLKAMDKNYPNTAKKFASKGSNGTAPFNMGAQTDFIYTHHDENTTVTSFDAFIFASRLKEFLNKNFVPLQDRLFFGDTMAPIDFDSWHNPKDPYQYNEPKFNYVEILAYAIERHRIEENAAGQKVLKFEKEYIMPASMDKDEMIQLVDAGVNYDTPYVYRVFCHVISVGTGVAYSSYGKEAMKGTSGDEYTTHVIKYYSYPDLRMMRVPVWQSPEQRIFDSLPAYPTTQIIPSRLDSSKVKIVFSDNLGGVRDVATPIFDADLPLYKKVLFRHDPTLQKEYGGIATVEDFVKKKLEVTFDTQSPLVKYQVLRIDKAPLDYSAFADAKIVEIERANGVGFEDSIETNKDYYYCFRAINAHGYPSNPSPVIHLNVYDDGDIHIGEVKPYAFPNEITEVPVIEPILCKGLFSVKLSDDQSIAGGFDPKKITTSKALLEKLQLTAMDEDKLQAMDTSGKTSFKLRATSRSTGRSIDFNFFPKIQTYDKLEDPDGVIGQEKTNSAFTPGDMIELANYFDLSTNAMKGLFRTEEEFTVDPMLIQLVVDKLQKNKLDQQALRSLLANFKKLKST